MAHAGGSADASAWETERDRAKMTVKPNEKMSKFFTKFSTKKEEAVDTKEKQTLIESRRFALALAFLYLASQRWRPPTGRQSSVRK